MRPILTVLAGLLLSGCVTNPWLPFSSSDKPVAQQPDPQTLLIQSRSREVQLQQENERLQQEIERLARELGDAKAKQVFTESSG